MDTWFHSVWQIVQANWHNSQVRKETEISIVHCALLLNLVKQPFSLSDCRAVLHESVRDVILKVSNVQDFRPLQLNMFEDFLNKKSTTSLPFRIKKHTAHHRRSIILVSHSSACFSRCWGCKTARTDGFLSPTIQPTLRQKLPNKIC